MPGPDVRPRSRAQGPSRYNGSSDLGPHMHTLSTASTSTHQLTALHVRATVGPKAKLDTYDGKDDWDSFIIPFERRAVIYRWSAVERVDKLHECLRGAAVKYLCSLPEHIREDYFLLKEQLAFRFGQKEPPTTARRRLGELRQSKETVSEFAEEVHRLVILAYPGVDIELREQIAADAFLKGLRNQKVAYEVMNRDPLLLDEAQRLVSSYEHNFKATLGRDFDQRGRTRRVSWADLDMDSDEEPQALQSRRVQTQGYVTQHQLQALIDKVDKLQLAIDRLPPPSSVALPSTVRPTHQTNSSMAVQSERGRTTQTSFKPNRYRQQNNSPTRASSGPRYQCGEEGHYKRNCSRSPSPSTSPPANAVARMEPPSQNRSEHAEQSPSIVHKLEGRCQQQAVESVKVEFRIGTKVLEWTVCIAPIRDALLLGLDFLKAADFTIHVSGKVFMGSELIPAFISEGKGPDYAISRVMLESDFTVPPECECLVWGLVDDPKPELPAVLEPVSLADGVSSGSIMIHMEQRIPVRLCNITASSRPLSRGVCLGVLIEAYPDAQEEGETVYSVPVNAQLYAKGGDLTPQDPNSEPPDEHNSTGQAYHANADALSRRALDEGPCDCYQAGRELDSLPCKGCPFCRKLHHQWARFEEDIDDVIPLAVRRTHSLNCQNESSCTNSSSHVNAVGADNSGPSTNWLQPLGLKSLKEEQLADPDLSILHKWMSDGSLPAKEEVMMLSPAVRKFWLCWSQVEMRDGILYYHWDDVTGGMSPLRLLVPASLKNEVLQACHNPAQAGHAGEEKTLMRLRSRYHWYNMGNDVRLFVKKCPQCSSCKITGQMGRAKLQNYQAGAPMDRLHLDVLEPFPESKSGNRYILVIID
ncbi:Retrovirus-related Pol polyprotein from transposon 412 [Labeo rohita]|uniref:Gypsy retrotransposon integrase-like protein 1 n=1 Tax=Labeo rohita TaxID=84645 RepID=A0A498P3W7_LABRO|nr:Retrovirus-related Pol polyprotein from transposon 412 [Labeo rohita]